MDSNLIVGLTGIFFVLDICRLNGCLLEKFLMLLYLLLKVLMEGTVFLTMIKFYLGKYLLVRHHGLVRIE